MRYLQLTSEDTVFAITSAGDNVLHYAINAKPRCIHTVDINPWCVAHINEPGISYCISVAKAIFLN
jgi:betaine lipid synthase